MHAHVHVYTHTHKDAHLMRPLAGLLGRAVRSVAGLATEKQQKKMLYEWHAALFVSNTQKSALL